MIVEVALPIALDPLSYSVPNSLLDDVTVGKAVNVPLRRKIISGYIVKVHKKEAKDFSYPIKDILKLDAEKPYLPESYLKFLWWIANYYHYPIGEVIKTALPSKLKLKKQKYYFLTEQAHRLSEEEEQNFSKRGGKKLALIEFLKDCGPQTHIPDEFKHSCSSLKKLGYISVEERDRNPNFIDAPNYPASKTIKSHNEEQLQAIDKICDSVDQESFKPYLLEGVTGSGKTEVYLSAAKHALQKEKTVIILVPEISLTPQLLSRVHRKLGYKIAVLHSALNDSQKAEQWKLITSGAAKLAIGARSTIFAPLENLGLIIVDEEHDEAFKQEDRLRYHARNLAIVRAQQANATVVLGSATPSLETQYQSISGKLEKISLKKRATNQSMPRVEVIDMKREKAKTVLSNRLRLLLQQTMEKKQQAMLFLNRRGFASFMICESCGDVPNCPNCSVSLTYYSKKNSYNCHYCGYQETFEKICSKCGEGELNSGSFGTESLEIEVQKEFPDARVCRIDRATTSKKGELEKMLTTVANKEVDIIIGTQIIAKGHDFPHVTLAAIINADVSLNIPDFRAAERSFQLFTQLAGRAGRGESEGTVLIQSFNPDHPSISFAKHHNNQGFSQQELEIRSAFHYPPFYRLVRILVSDNSDQQAQQSIQRIFQKIEGLKTENYELLGPAPAMLHKIQNKYRWHILLKAKQASLLNTIVKSIASDCIKEIPKSTAMHIDVDPVSLL